MIKAAGAIQHTADGAAIMTVYAVPAIAICIMAVLLLIAAAVLAYMLVNRKKAKAEKPLLRECPEVWAVHEQGAREYQEDSYVVSDTDNADVYGTLAVVSDGMGGLEKGDQVSDTVVTTAINGFYRMQGDSDQILLALLTWANQAVNGLLGPAQQGKSGATVVMGLLKNSKFHYLSVGDSRICLYRNGRLIQLNREHVFRNELMLRVVNKEISFQEASAHPKAAGLTGYLGQGQIKHIDLPAQPVEALPGDRFILMSDGVYNALSNEEISSALDKEPKAAAEAIHQMIANKNYSNQDNYTAVIMAC